MAHYSHPVNTEAELVSGVLLPQHQRGVKSHYAQLHAAGCAQPSLGTQIENARAELSERESEASVARSRVEWARAELDELIARKGAN